MIYYVGVRRISSRPVGKGLDLEDLGNLRCLDAESLSGAIAEAVRVSPVCQTGELAVLEIHRPAECGVSHIEAMRTLAPLEVFLHLVIVNDGVARVGILD